MAFTVARSAHRQVRRRPSFVCWLVPAAFSTAAAVLGSAAHSAGLSGGERTLQLDCDRVLNLAAVPLGDHGNEVRIEVLSLSGIAGADLPDRVPLQVAAGRSVTLVLSDSGLLLQIGFDVRQSHGLIKASIVEANSGRHAPTSLRKQTRSAKRIALRRLRNQNERNALRRRQQQIARALPKLRTRYAATAPATLAKLLLFQQISNLQLESQRASTKIAQQGARIAAGTAALQETLGHLKYLQQLAAEEASIRFRVVSD